ncbi:hypothetical protein C2I33_10845 [Ralstonia solanacearum]|uniref:condensin complex protein MksE n=1 Tax=Ralstonia solanacearum TaxID=305 RepID=UPI0001816701|nr:hypothetical protein [Ralstonia solanacearum]MDC6179676.1 hypothetical protein [Ralstonia solanacearum]MDC6212248.1 hypothetical protein [Ralstonia solanacearum]MDC6241225.1 hypothetical protein [Ralstonia solanacearum]MDD7802735.1 hypothetical protein [Ralstonia solanacearum]TYZ54884.1 hypothetical protein C2I33_10845 [Ralstonia solanacearum]
MDLPDKFEEAFDSLTKGRHISSYDGEVFKSLMEHTARYRQLFDALGYELVSDPQGFFHFNGTKQRNLSKSVEQAALFTFIMVDWLSDNDSSVEDGLFSDARAIKDLPHLQSDRYRSYMRQAGGDDENNLKRIINAMERSGFLRVMDDKIQFLAPVRRILKICMALTRKTPTMTPDAEPAGAGEEA